MSIWRRCRRDVGEGWAGVQSSYAATEEFWLFSEWGGDQWRVSIKGVTGPHLYFIKTVLAAMWRTDYGIKVRNERPVRRLP